MHLHSRRVHIDTICTYIHVQCNNKYMHIRAYVHMYIHTKTCTGTLGHHVCPYVHTNNSVSFSYTKTYMHDYICRKKYFCVFFMHKNSVSFSYTKTQIHDHICVNTKSKLMYTHRVYIPSNCYKDSRLSSCIRSIRIKIKPYARIQCTQKASQQQMWKQHIFALLVTSRCGRNV